MPMNRKRLKNLREQAGLTQEELARRANVSVSLVSKYERGEERNPTTKTLLALSRVLSPLLGKSVNQVLTELAAPDELEAGKGGKA